LRYYLRCATERFDDWEKYVAIGVCVQQLFYP